MRRLRDRRARSGLPISRQASRKSARAVSSASASARKVPACRVEVEGDAGIVHSGDCRRRGGLNSISGGLRPEIGEQRRAEPPEPNDVARGVTDLVFAKLWLAQSDACSSLSRSTLR